MRRPPTVQLRPDERVWVTGDVHLAPEDEARAALFLRFLAAAQEGADRLVILGDLFDFWVGPRFGRGCAFGPVLEALEAATRDGFPVDFVAGNREFFGPHELIPLGLAVHEDLVILARGTERTVVTHGDLLVAGDLSYKRYRRVARSWFIRLGYRLVPEWFRVLVAANLRRWSRRKLVNVKPYDFPIDLAAARAWLTRHEARDLLMGHLHREETHEHPEGVTRMLPGWSEAQGPYFLAGPPAELRTFSPAQFTSLDSGPPD